MTFDVRTGGASRPPREVNEMQDAAIASGRMTRTIFLNGGSQTRRDARAYWREMYAGSNSIEVVESGFMVVIRRRDA